VRPRAPDPRAAAAARRGRPPSDLLPVLVADGDEGTSRTPLATVQALVAAGYPAAVTVSSARSLAAASRLPFRKVAVPKAPGEPFLAAIRAERARGGYLTVLAASDVALLSLDPGRIRLVDKASLLDEAAKVGLQTPSTRVFDSSDGLLGAAGSLDYPVVVKPALGHLATLARGPADLGWLAGSAGRWLVQPYLDAPMRSIAGVRWRGRVVAAVHQRFLRTWPPECGMACAAETTAPDQDLERRVGDLLGDEDGVFQADFIQDGLLLDLNPRVYATLPLAVAAGVNLVGWYCDLLGGRREPGPDTERAVPGVFFRWLDGDARHLLTKVRRHELSLAAAAGALAHRRGSAHAFQLLRDPGPVLVRARRAWSADAGGGVPFDSGTFPEPQPGEDPAGGPP